MPAANQRIGMPVFSGAEIFLNQRMQLAGHPINILNVLVPDPFMQQQPFVGAAVYEFIQRPGGIRLKKSGRHEHRFGKIINNQCFPNLLKTHLRAGDQLFEQHRHGFIGLARQMKLLEL